MNDLPPISHLERRDPDLDIVRLARRRSTRNAAMGILYERLLSMAQSVREHLKSVGG